MVQDELEYEVDDIFDHKVKSTKARKSYEYLVMWKGYD